MKGNPGSGVLVSTGGLGIKVETCCRSPRVPHNTLAFSTFLLWNKPECNSKMQNYGKG